MVPDEPDWLERDLTEKEILLLTESIYHQVLWLNSIFAMAEQWHTTQEEMAQSHTSQCPDSDQVPFLTDE